MSPSRSLLKGRGYVYPQKNKHRPKTGFKHSNTIISIFERISTNNERLFQKSIEFQYFCSSKSHDETIYSLFTAGIFTPYRTRTRSRETI